MRNVDVLSGLMKAKCDLSSIVEKYLSMNLGDVRKDILACGLRGLRNGRVECKTKKKLNLKSASFFFSRTKSTRSMHDTTWRSVTGLNWVLPTTIFPFQINDHASGIEFSFISPHLSFPTLITNASETKKDH